MNKLNQIKKVFSKPSRAQLEAEAIEEAFMEDDRVIVSMRKQIEDYEKVLTNFANGRRGELLSAFEHRVMRQSYDVLGKWKKKLKK